MAVKRTVGCPHCGAPKVIKAAPLMRLKCSSCEKPFRAPAIDDDLPVAAAADEPAAAAAAGAPSSDAPPATGARTDADAVPPSPPARSGGVSVARATPKVGAPAVQPADVDDDQVDDVDETSHQRDADVVDDAGHEHGHSRAQRRAKAAGRRGGHRTAENKRAATGAYARSTGRG